jgi:heme/copper-type cytochrome/quinol oxidase subunit 2
MAWQILFGSDIGLLSLGTIAFVIVMAIYFIIYFNKKAVEDEAKAQMAQRK